MATVTTAGEGVSKIDLSGGQKFMKYVIMGLSVLYLIFGCVLCAVGSYATTGTSADLAGSTLANGLIAIGVFLIVTSLIGFVSSFYEIRLGLWIFFVLMLLWTIILISIGIAVYAEQNNVQNIMANAWVNLPNDLKLNIESSFGCCGRYSNEPNSTGYSMYGYNCPDWSAVGCITKLAPEIEDNLNTAGACGIAFAVIMAVGLAFTCFLMRGIQAKGYTLALEKTRARTEKDLEERRRRGKGGLKIPDTVL